MEKHIIVELPEGCGGIYKNIFIQFRRDFKKMGKVAYGEMHPDRCWYATAHRFGRYLAVYPKLQKIKNVCGKHIRAYVQFLREQGMSENYIRKEIAAIRIWHEHSDCRKRLPDDEHLFSEA